MKGVIATNLFTPGKLSPRHDLATARLAFKCLGYDFIRRTLICDADLQDPILRDQWPVQGILQRDAAVEIGGSRHLPFIQEIMDKTLITAENENQWIGFLNSDVLVTNALFEALNKDNDIVLPVVTDIDHIDHLETGPFHKRPGDPANPMCCDGVFMRASIWMDNRDKVPDYVLGECYWDAGYLRHFGGMPKAVILDNGECLHVKHKGGWDTGNVDWTLPHPTGFTVTGEYNLKLYYQDDGE